MRDEPWIESVEEIRMRLENRELTRDDYCYVISHAPQFLMDKWTTAQSSRDFAEAGKVLEDMIYHVLTEEA